MANTTKKVSELTEDLSPTPDDITYVVDSPGANKASRKVTLQNLVQYGGAAVLAGKANTTHTHAESDVTGLTTDLAAKQATLVSGTNIKTVNGTTLLGSGDLSVTTADATDIAKGVVQLTNDLGGTASSPTTPTAVHRTGNETIAGVKTFSASPQVPTPTNPTDASTKGYVDTQDALKVSKTGDSITVSTGNNRNGLTINQNNTVDNPTGVKINNTAASNAIEVVQSGNTGTDVSLNGAVHINNNANAGIGLGVYSNRATTSAPLTIIKNDSINPGQHMVELTTASQNLADDALRITSNGGATGARGLYIQQNSDAAAIIIDATGAPHTNVGANMTVFNIDGANTDFSMVKLTNNGVSTTNNSNVFAQNLQSTTTSRVFQANQVGQGSAIYVDTQSTSNPGLEIGTSKYGVRTVMTQNGGYGLSMATDGVHTLSASAGLANFKQLTTSDTAPVLTVDNRSSGKSLRLVNNATETFSVAADGTVNHNGTRITGVGTPTTSTDVATKGYVDGSAKSSIYVQLAASPDALIFGTITRDANEAATSASVIWPDGTTGTYTADTVSSSFPGAVDAYHITYAGSTTVTYTQPTVTRDSNGAVTTRPALVVT